MISRSILLGRLIKNYLPRDSKTAIGHQQHRYGSHAFVYRVASPPAPKSVSIAADVVGGFMWWWIFWHLWHEYKHITGEFEYPDASSWTNAELGIPSD